MKTNHTNEEKRYLRPILGALFALSATGIQAGTMGPAPVTALEKVYFSVFGGGGTSNKVKMSQYGTALFPEADGGPLAVNAFGRANSRSVGMVGGHVGYQWGDVFLDALRLPLGLAPAAELEGYYLGKGSFKGHEINNDVTRLPEHDFLVTYPVSSGIFLANAVLNFNAANYYRWHPYVAAGIGAAVISVSNADSLQVAPLEAGVNHYNANPNDTVSAFAAQTKVGLNFDLCEHISLFGEYRWLYIANTKFAFGSTVYPAHAATSHWNATLGSQHYNMGAGGIRITL